MKPSKIFIVRHGQSVGNANKSVYQTVPDYALTLTDKGKQQAIDVGQELQGIIGPEEPIQFYVSPFWRTRQTFLGIKESFTTNDITYYEDPRLREQEWGTNLENKDGLKTKLEEYRDNYGHFYYRFASGESCADVYDRVSDFMGTMFRDFTKPNYPQNVIIVIHGMTMRLFLMRWFHANVEEFESWKNPKNGGYFELELGEDDKYKLITPLIIRSVKHDYQFDWGNNEKYSHKL
jgi:broad specificity phosphatase PhoE